MKFSIIIPAHNEADILSETLASLRRLGTPKRDFEIVVVDNNSSDATAQVARENGADKVIFEKEQGTNLAREAGRRAASGEIMVFLDADSTPPIDWLSRIEEELSVPGVVAVSGPYDYGFAPPLSWISAFYEGVVIPAIPFFLRLIFWRKAGVLIGGNFAVWGWALQNIGGLPPFKFWGDDAALAMLLARRVGKVRFDPGLKVKSSPRRFEKEGLFKINTRYILAYLKVYFRKDLR
jgi:glycosyltransferase involved in cell wall biosynthesis